MTEYETADLAASIMANFLGSITIFLSIVTAYVVAAFTAGVRRTTIQLIVVNVSFLLSTGSIGVISLISFQRATFLARQSVELVSEVPIPLFDFTSVFVLLYLTLVTGSLVFMWNVRRVGT